MTDAEFEAVFRQHKDAVFRFAWRMTGSAAAAEDVAQDVFLELLRQPGRFDAARGSLRAFLLGIARNLALKRWRREHRWEPLEDDDALQGPPAPAIDIADVAGAVGRAVQALPPFQREVVILAEYEELTLAEIAHAVGTGIGTVKSRLHRARERLRRMLAPLNPVNQSARGLRSFP